MYKDTPLKRTVRELKRDWQPVFPGLQETPPFAEMQYMADNHDDTSFEEEKQYKEFVDLLSDYFLDEDENVFAFFDKENNG